MTKLPKLKINNHFVKPIVERICDLKEGENILRDYLPEDYKDKVITASIVAIEGQLVHTYDEIIEIANQDFYKNKEFLEVVVHPAFGGG